MTCKVYKHVEIGRLHAKYTHIPQQSHISRCVYTLHRGRSRKRDYGCLWWWWKRALYLHRKSLSLHKQSHMSLSAYTLRDTLRKIPKGRGRTLAIVVKKGSLYAQKSPISPPKEPHLSAKEPYLSRRVYLAWRSEQKRERERADACDGGEKKPCISAKETYLSTKRALSLRLSL